MDSKTCTIQDRFTKGTDVFEQFYVQNFFDRMADITTRMPEINYENQLFLSSKRGGEIKPIIYL